MLLPANHWLFQLANASLFFSFISYDLLVLRVVLAVAALFFMLWGALILDYSLDTILWNAVFFLINLTFAVRIAYSRRPIHFDRIEHERLYKVLFAQTGMPRLDFKELCKLGHLKKAPRMRPILEEEQEMNFLSLVCSGSLEVRKRNRKTGEQVVLNELHDFEFLESPEWTMHFSKQRRFLRATNAPLASGTTTVNPSFPPALAPTSPGDTTNTAASLSPGATTRRPTLLPVASQGGAGAGHNGTAASTSANGNAGGSDELELLEAGLAATAPQYDEDPAKHAASSTERADTEHRQTFTLLWQWLSRHLAVCSHREPLSYASPLPDESAASSSFTVMKVSIVPVSDCVILQWPLVTLIDFLKPRPSTLASLSLLIGMDVSAKLMRQTTQDGSKLHTMGLEDIITSPPITTSPSADAAGGAAAAAAGAAAAAASDASVSGRALASPLSAATAAVIEGGLGNLGTVSSGSLPTGAGLARQATARLREVLACETQDVDFVLQMARWRRARRADKIVIQCGEDIHALCMVLDGELLANERDDTPQSVLGPGSFVGAEEFISQVPTATFSVLSRGPALWLEWDAGELHSVLKHNPSLSAAFHAAICADLARRCRALMHTAVSTRSNSPQPVVDVPV